MSIVRGGFIIAFFIICCVVYSTQLLDHFLHSRFLAASLLAFMLSVYLLFTKKKKAVKPLRTTLSDLLLTAFVGLNFLSLCWAQEKSEALFGAQKWFLVLAYFYLCKRLFSDNPADELFRFIATVARWTTVVVLSLVTYHLIQIGVVSGMSNEALYDLQVMFGHKSLISAFIFLLLPLNLLGTQKPQIHWFVLLIICWQLLVILLLQSRTVYLCMLLSFFLVAHFLYTEKKLQIKGFSTKYIYLFLILFTLGLLLLFRVPQLSERLDISSYFKSQTATERQLVWKISKPLIRDHWILGVGTGNWKIEFPGRGVEGSYRMQDQNVFFTRAHNDYLEILAELGVPGLALYLAIFGMSLWRLWIMRKKFRWQNRMLMTGITGFMVMSFIDFPKERIEFLMLFALYLGLIDLITTKSGSWELGQKTQKLITALLAIGLLANIYTGYYRYLGESSTKLLLKARVQEKWEEVVRLSSNAKNTWHKLDPSSVPIDFYTGVALYNLGKKQDAMTVFERAHKIAPYNFHVLNNLGTLEIENGNYDKAIAWLEEAIRINSRFEDALFNLAYCYVEKERYQDALDQIMAIPTESEKKELFKTEIRKRQLD